eukprot:2262621-Pleurochrysis_carterae.AAC.2
MSPAAGKQPLSCKDIMQSTAQLHPIARRIPRSISFAASLPAACCLNCREAWLFECQEGSRSHRDFVASCSAARNVCKH